jgi:hypothetical protein
MTATAVAVAELRTIECIEPKGAKFELMELTGPVMTATGPAVVDVELRTVFELTEFKLTGPVMSVTTATGPAVAAAELRTIEPKDAEFELTELTGPVTTGPAVADAESVEIKRGKFVVVAPSVFSSIFSSKGFRTCNQNIK